jgi:hypothetical protein
MSPERLSCVTPVAMRGFSGRYAGKLLVLADRRTVDTPALSGLHPELSGTQGGLETPRPGAAPDRSWMLPGDWRS